MKKLLCMALFAALVLSLCACGMLSSDKEDNSSVDNVSADSVESSESSNNSGLMEESFYSAPDSSLFEEIEPESSEEEGTEKEYNGFKYIVENDVARIVDYNGTPEELVVPDSLEGYTVTAIAEGAFSGLNTVKELVVGDTVVNIGLNAFKGCGALGAVTLGNSVAVIEQGCFDDCDMLKRIDVDATNGSFASVDGILYTRDLSTLIRCPQAYGKEEFAVEQGTTLISEGAFRDCVKLTKLTLADNCALSSASFYQCINLKEIVFATGLIAIPDRCFFGAVLLEKIALPEGIESVGDYSFFGCVAATELALPQTITAISDTAFSCCAFKKVTAHGAYGQRWYEDNKASIVKK